jgi:hypothetical protein
VPHGIKGSTPPCIECGKPSAARSLCPYHYNLWRATRPGGACSVEGCEDATVGRGLCGRHYARWKRTGIVGTAEFGPSGHGRGLRRGVCSVEGCGRPHFARGWCRPHYYRVRRTGRAVPPTDAERFWAKVDKKGPPSKERPDLGPCWLWTGARGQGGYGSTGKGGAHRKAYRLTKGPIPPDFQIDHLCYVRNCVNPAHLEAVTRLENIRRTRRRVICPRCGDRLTTKRCVPCSSAYSAGYKAALRARFGP